MNIPSNNEECSFREKGSLTLHFSRDHVHNAIRELDGFLADSRRTSSPRVRGTFFAPRIKIAKPFLFAVTPHRPIAADNINYESKKT